MLRKEIFVLIKNIVFIILWIFPITLMAQEEKIKSNQYTLSGALDSNSAWELEFSYMRRIFPYIGIGAGINIYHQYSDEISASGGNVPGTSISQWILSNNSKQATGLVFNPFVHIKTPTLFHIDEMGVNIFTEPGLSIAFLTDKNVGVNYWNGSGYYDTKTFYGHGGNWLYWHYRIGGSMENEDVVLSMGYFASNIDFYSYKRNIRIENVRLGDNLPKKHFNWGIFISLGYKF
ncbi:MAG: hypothetical protein LKI18_04815 [Prevotella sp.]|jgi:hypothetical protein|nr:hypothetical protein [Prevotella sp.]